jgi:hypothetical protein
MLMEADLACMLLREHVGLIVLVGDAAHPAVLMVRDRHPDLLPTEGADIAPTQFVVLLLRLLSSTLDVLGIVFAVLHLLVGGHEVEVFVGILVEFVDLKLSLLVFALLEFDKDLLFMRLNTERILEFGEDVNFGDDQHRLLAVLARFALLLRQKDTSHAVIMELGQPRHV